MNTEATLQINSVSSKDTEQLGEQLGKQLKGGEVIELIGDLGSGKTTFVKGLARGAGSLAVATSPSFVLSKIYPAKNFEIYHFDFYRLDDAGTLGLELEEHLNDRQKVVVIEWGQSVAHVLPSQRAVINFGHMAHEGRTINLNLPPELAYLKAGLK